MVLTRRAIVTLLAWLVAAKPTWAVGRPVRFGLTAVVVRENLPFFRKWSDYLERKVGRPVHFVQRRSYREIMELLEVGEVDFAWICGYPFIRRRDPEFLELLAVPLFEGAPIYRSYIIVRRDSPVQGLDDLSGKVFAFSDPDSNSGYLAPRAMLARMGSQPDTFFRITFFTYSHAETVEAVARGVADGGAVDSYVWEYLNRSVPDLAGRTRVIRRSQPFGFPPLVARKDGDPHLKDAMRGALLAMRDDPEGKQLLTDLQLDGFGEFAASLFDDIRLMAAELSSLGRQ